MRRKRKYASKIPMDAAGEVAGLADLNYSVVEISEATGIPYSSIDAIVHGRGKWSEITRDEGVFSKFREALKRRMQAKSGVIADKLLDSVNKKSASGSLSQAAIAYGILRTHGRLDAGEPTEHHAHVHRQSVKDIDELARRLGDSLLKGDKETPAKG